MDWIHSATFQFETGILIFARVMSILSSVPLFGTRQIPALAKIGFIYFIVLILLALEESFRIIPLGHPHFTVQSFVTLNGFMVRMFVLGLQLALPTVGAIFLTNFSLGFLSRLVPQMNVFFVGFSMTLLVGFTVTF